ncbi:MAG: alcohol dehydrogenase catalytic domain-containing protein [Chloroflexi bacterium]|nr:alcohol dehydrogenase catalytic domain-containing protein [Chloroflexota bacterium]
MKAAVLKQFNAPLSIEDIPEPMVEPGWALVRVKACGLCGTDLKISSGAMPNVKIPVVPGHEIAGEVLKVGEGVTNIAPGDQVVVYTYVTCGRCRECQEGWDNLCANLGGILGSTLNGGDAEIVKAPAANLIPITPQISFEQAAILADAIATPYHALRRRAKVEAGQTIVIVGVGGLGLHAVQIASALGLHVLAVDVEQSHLDMAVKLGAEFAINSAVGDPLEAIFKATGKRGVDVVLELSGYPEAARNALSFLLPRGRMVLVGYHATQPFEVSSKTMVSKELEICASRFCTRQDLVEVIEWVDAGKVNPIIQETMPLSQINQAYQKLKSGKVLGRLVIQI